MPNESYFIAVAHQHESTENICWQNSGTSLRANNLTQELFPRNKFFEGIGLYNYEECWLTSNLVVCEKIAKDDRVIATRSASRSKSKMHPGVIAKRWI